MTWPEPPQGSGTVLPSSWDGGTDGWSTGAKVGLAVSIVAAIVICSVPMAGFFVYWFLGPDLDDAKATAGQYFDRIEVGDDTGAYRLLCTKAQNEMTQDSFAAKLKDGSRPVDHTVLNGSFLGESGYEALIDVRLVTGSGAIREVNLTLNGGDKNRWRVCGDTFI
ncbi:hypothetical protein [Couchioplanes caeruleus]|nr:hypothetical protein [Couchioplanes caeruleus]